MPKWSGFSPAGKILRVTPVTGAARVTGLT